MQLQDRQDDNVSSEERPGLAALAETLLTIDRPGDFCAEGLHGGVLPRVDVEGFGPIPMPFPAMLVGALASRARPAPYGRGMDTLVDPEVRRCLQIGPDSLELPDRIWSPLLATLTRRAAEGLGVVGGVEAQLYKLLIYQQGDFFLPHRDSEKAAGMFGTLVVVLPSGFTGGELVVEHGGQARRLSLQPAHIDELAWAAFYADCSHELRPLTTGVRLALVFNLVRRGAVAPPQPRKAVEAVAGGLRGCFDENGPAKVVCVLDHHYTEAGLAWEDLKGPDSARAQALRTAAAEQGLIAHLGAISLTESWSAEELYDRRRGDYREFGPEDVELYDLCESDCRVESLVDAEGHGAGIESIPVFDEELCPPRALIDEPPDAFHYHEATGNAGGTAERTYRRAAVILWPAAHDVAVLGQAGPAALWQALTRAESAGDMSRADALLDELAARAGSTESLRQAWEQVLKPELLTCPYASVTIGSLRIA